MIVININILALGDVVGEEGCNFLRKKLSSFKRLKGIDFCIANGENAAKGNGITPDALQSLFVSGVDFVTSGNHIYKRKEIYNLLDESEFIIRPFNFHKNNPGKGYALVDTGRNIIGILNLSGRVFMEDADNPFFKADEALEIIRKETNIILVDFHAEATSEKAAMGYYLDSKVSAVFGTHTHVLTADAKILEGGTGYITDIGMCGAMNGVLGVDKNIIINKFKYNMPARFDPAKGECEINGCIFSIDEKSGKCTSVEAVRFS